MKLYFFTDKLYENAELHIICFISIINFKFATPQNKFNLHYTFKNCINSKLIIVLFMFTNQTKQIQTKIHCNILKIRSAPLLCTQDRMKTLSQLTSWLSTMYYYNVHWITECTYG